MPLGQVLHPSAPAQEEHAWGGGCGDPAELRADEQ
jgi:hypothetical protein